MYIMNQVKGKINFVFAVSCSRYFLSRIPPDKRRSIKWSSPSCSRTFRLSDYRPFNRDAIQSQCYFPFQYGVETCCVSTGGTRFRWGFIFRNKKQDKPNFPSKKKLLFVTMYWLLFITMYWLLCINCYYVFVTMYWLT